MYVRSAEPVIRRLSNRSCVPVALKLARRSFSLFPVSDRRAQCVRAYFRDGFSPLVKAITY